MFEIPMEVEDPRKTLYQYLDDASTANDNCNDNDIDLDNYQFPSDIPPPPLRSSKPAPAAESAGGNEDDALPPIPSNVRRQTLLNNPVVQNDMGIYDTTDSIYDTTDS